MRRRPMKRGSGYGAPVVVRKRKLSVEKTWGPKNVVERASAGLEEEAPADRGAFARCGRRHDAANLAANDGEDAAMKDQHVEGVDEA